MSLLDSWTKKHRNVKIIGGPWVVRGDGWEVELSGHARGDGRVVVSGEPLPLGTSLDTLIDLAVSYWDDGVNGTYQGGAVVVSGFPEPKEARP